MTDVTFSARFNTIDNEAYRYAIRAIEESNVRLGVLVQVPELAIRRIQKWLFPQAIKARINFVRFIRKVLSDRLKASKSEHSDIFSFVQQAKDPDSGKGLDITELSTETATLIIAGKMLFYSEIIPSSMFRSRTLKLAQDLTPPPLQWQPLFIISAFLRIATERLKTRSEAGLLNLTKYAWVRRSTHVLTFVLASTRHFECHRQVAAHFGVKWVLVAP